MIHFRHITRWPAQECHVNKSWNENQQLKQFIRFFLLTSAWVAAVLYLSINATTQGSLWLVLAATLLIAIPALMAALYTSTVTIIHRSTAFNTSGMLKRLTTSRILSTLFWAIWALLFGFITVFWLSSLTDIEIGSLFLAMIVLFALKETSLKMTTHEMAPYYANAAAIRMSRALLAILMTALFLAFTLLTQESLGEESLAKRLGQIAEVPLDQQKSYLVQIASKFMAYLQTTRTFMLEQTSEVAWLHTLIVVVGTFALFLNYSFLLSGFLIPVVEYRRVFAPIEACEIPGTPAMGTTIFISAVVTISSLLLLSMVSSIEFSLRHGEYARQFVTAAEGKFVHLAEEIDTIFYEVGTIEEITDVRMAALSGQSDLLLPIREQANRAFVAMRGNVDVYLDKYYSLPAEYFRIVGALTGNIEAQIKRDLKQTLMAGEEIANIDSVIENALKQKPVALEKYKKEVAAILERNEISKPSGTIVVVESSTLAAIQAPPENAVLVNFENRMGASTVTAIGTVIAAKVVSKVAAKGAIKVAAKGITKAVTTKLGSGATGAAIGAAIGSFVPVAGTAVGMAIGFTVGIALGVSVDALLLMLEEYYSRGEFRAQIIESINEQERDFNALIMGYGECHYFQKQPCQNLAR